MSCTYCGRPLDAQAVQTPRGWQHGACVAAQQGQAQVAVYGAPYYQPPYPAAYPAAEADVLPAWWYWLLYATIPLCGLHFPIAIIARVLSMSWRGQYPNKAATLRKHQIISSLITAALGFGVWLALQAISH